MTFAALLVKCLALDEPSPFGGKSLITPFLPDFLPNPDSEAPLDRNHSNIVLDALIQLVGKPDSLVTCYYTSEEARSNLDFVSSQ